MSAISATHVCPGAETCACIGVCAAMDMLHVNVNMTASEAIRPVATTPTHNPSYMATAGGSSSGDASVGNDAVDLEQTRSMWRKK